MNEERLTIRISPAFLARIDALRPVLERDYPHARKGRAGAARILLDEAMARREARHDADGPAVIDQINRAFGLSDGDDEGGE